MHAIPHIDHERNVFNFARFCKNGPSGTAWERTLSTAGVEGTLASRMLGADTAGRFFGKTGTLYDTIATSGVLEHAHDGHRYVFGILFNDVTSQSTARSYCDQIVEAVASDRRQRGTRPSPPVLNTVPRTGSSTQVPPAPSTVASVNPRPAPTVSRAGLRAGRSGST